MTRRLPPGIARFDSASAMAQALGACLHGRPVASLSGSPLMDRLMPLVNHLPRRAAEWVYALGGMSEGVRQAEVAAIDIAAIADWLVGLFPPRSYPAAFIGSSNGALTHLAAAMGIPWLPQTFLCPVRASWRDPDDLTHVIDEMRPLTGALQQAQPTLSIHHMHDPNQDRLMLQLMRYFRLKFRALPDAYRDFLIRHLPAGATLYVDDCTRSWPVTRIGERAVFQFGALGGLTAEQYRQSGAAVRAYFQRYNPSRTSWDPPPADELAPEAEWGFEPALLQDLRRLAAAQGWRLVHLRFDDPEALSLLTAAIYRAWYATLGCRPTRLLAETFILLDPYRCLRLRAVPLWLLFAVKRSARLFAGFVESHAAFAEIDLTLFSHGTSGAGLATLDDWRRPLARATKQGCLLGVDESRYPRDFATFTRFHQALAALGLPYELPPPLSPALFETLARRHGPAFGVTLEGPAPAPPPGGAQVSGVGSGKT